MFKLTEFELFFFIFFYIWEWRGSILSCFLLKSVDFMNHLESVGYPRLIYIHYYYLTQIFWPNLPWFSNSELFLTLRLLLKTLIKPLISQCLIPPPLTAHLGTTRRRRFRLPTPSPPILCRYVRVLLFSTSLCFYANCAHLSIHMNFVCWLG